MPTVRVVTFNLEELDDRPQARPTLAERISIMRPQLERARADILCLQEVHGQGPEPWQLLALEQLVAGPPLAYPHRACGPVGRWRNLVVLSHFPFIGQPELIKNDKIDKLQYCPVTATPPNPVPRPYAWERPILKVRINLGQNRVLHLLNVHMKSKIPAPIPGRFTRRGSFNVFHTVSAWAEGLFISEMQRVGQAIEARILIDEIFDAAAAANEEALIAMCGDFNDDNDQTAVKAIRGPIEEIANEALVHRVMIPCEMNIPESSRYSLLHMGRGEMIDHILVSRGMLRYFRRAEIHNETLPDESGAFRTDDKFPESDHAPVVAEFEIP